MGILHFIDIWSAVSGVSPSANRLTITDAIMMVKKSRKRRLMFLVSLSKENFRTFCAEYDNSAPISTINQDICTHKSNSGMAAKAP